MDKPAPTHLGWAIFVTLLGAGSLLGIIAIIFAAMASGANAKRDYADARAKAKVASILAWLAFIIDLVAIFCIVLSFSLVSTDGIMDEANKSATRTTISSIDSAATTWKIRHGKNPDSIDLLLQPDGDREPLLPDKATTDAWGNEIQYRFNGGMLDIRSAGPDGRMNTSDDITNWGR